MSDTPNALSPEDEASFDELVEDAIAALPAELQDLLEECPVIVQDRPDPRMLTDLGLDPAAAADASSDDFCGMHSGISDLELSVEHSGELPSQIHLFRLGILAAAEAGPSDRDDDTLDRVYDEIAVTLLHEIGHQFGLDEDDLERLGYA